MQHFFFQTYKTTKSRVYLQIYPWSTPTDTWALVIRDYNINGMGGKTLMSTSYKMFRDDRLFVHEQSIYYT